MHARVFERVRSTVAATLSALSENSVIKIWKLKWKQVFFYFLTDLSLKAPQFNTVLIFHTKLML